MANINEILARAAALRDETALNSISPERAGGIMYDTLLALNELWLQQGAALVISKIYASVAAMEADTAPVSDLTGNPLRPGQIVVIASSDSDNGSVYRYNGTESPSWSLVGSIGNLDPVDSLDSDSTTLPLAAHQGKVLDGKISQLGQETNIVNVNQANNVPTTAYETAVIARGAVPAGYRRYGVVISYLLSDGWHIEQYNGPAVNPWQTSGVYWLEINNQMLNTLYNCGTTVQTLQQAVSSCPTVERKVGRAILFMSSTGLNIGLFNGAAVARWEQTEYWTVIGKGVLDTIQNAISKIEISIDGKFSGEYEQTGTSSGFTYVEGTSSSPGVLLNSNKFYLDIHSIDSYGKWRFYMFYEDGTNGWFSDFTTGLKTLQKKARGVSVAISSTTNTCSISFDVYSNLELALFTLGQGIADVRASINELSPEDIGAVAIEQGLVNVGKTLIVGQDGNVVPGTVTPIGVLSGYAKTDNVVELFLKADIASEVSVGTGWSGDLVNGYAHSSGTEALVLGHTENGKKYLVTIDFSGALENSIEVKIGNTYPVDPYNGTRQSLIGFLSDGGDLTIIPNTDFTGTIKAKLQEITTQEESVESVNLDVDNFDAGLMISSVSGFWNVAIGPDSNTMGSLINASRCIGIGLNALRNLISGSRNIGIGTFALSQLKYGKGNIGIGADAYYQRENGNDNVAIGRASMGGAYGSVNNNVCVGVSAGERATGDNNVCIGPVAGYGAAGGGVFIGPNTGFSHNAGLNNTFIGRNAGYSGAQKTGNWNVCIGPSADAENGVSKSVAIGFHAVATKSSQNVIGSADSQETKVFGDLVVHGTDGVDRRIVFNSDHSVTWEEVV